MTITAQELVTKKSWLALLTMGLLMAAPVLAGGGHSAASSTRPGVHSTGHVSSATTQVSRATSRSGAAASTRPSGRSSRTAVAGVAGRRSWRSGVGLGWYYPGYSYWGYPGYYLGLSLGYYGVYPGPYWWGGYYRVPATYGGGGYGPAYMEPGALDLNVKPKRAEVYVNGDAVGHIGHYDGFPDYLWLQPGHYELIFYLDGYRTERREVTVRAGLIQDVRFSMQRGSAKPVSEVSHPPVTPPAAPRPRGPEAWRERLAAPEWNGNGQQGTGHLELDIEPDEASVYLDGRPLGAARDLEQRQGGILVPSGPHTLEVVYPGMQGVSQSFEMQSDGQVALRIHLEPAE